MRALPPLALVLIVAVPIQAQEANVPAPAAEAVQVIDTDAVPRLDGPRAAGKAPTLQAPQVPVQPAPAAMDEGAGAVQNELQTRAVEAMDARQAASRNASWWWFVAAVVAGMLILMALGGFSVV